MSYPHPIGFDTVYYAARIESGVVWDNWGSVFSSWLLYALLISTRRIVHVDPFLLLKLVAPLLYALNVCGIYYFASEGLNWKVRSALMAAFFFAFQLGALRISWDLYRNALGLAILLFALPTIRRAKSRKDFVVSTLLSLLVVFVHELVSIVLFIIVLGVLISNFLKDERARCRNVLLSSLPALGMVLIMVALFPMQIDPLDANVVNTYEPSSHSLEMFLFTDYLTVSESWYYPTYLHLASHVLLLFLILCMLGLPLVFVGFFRDTILDSWTLLLLFWSFNALIMPFFALKLWHRSMFMLVYPFTFYAVNGVKRVLGSQRGHVHPNLGWLRQMKISRRIVYGIWLLMVFSGSLFVTVGFSYLSFSSPVTSPPLLMPYFPLPSTMLQSTVPLQDVESVVEAMEWLNRRMTDNSCVLVHSAFISWAKLDLDRENMIIYYVRDIEEASSVAVNLGFGVVYLIWWNENIGWYDLAVPAYFSGESEDFGRVSIFKYLVPVHTESMNSFLCEDHKSTKTTGCESALLTEVTYERN